MVSRGQGPKQRFSWRKGDGVGDGSGSKDIQGTSLTVSCLVSRVLCLVSSCTWDGKKKRRWKGKRQLPRASTDVDKGLAKVSV